MFENMDERALKFGLVIAAVVIIFSIPFAVVTSKSPKSDIKFQQQERSLNESVEPSNVEEEVIVSEESEDEPEERIYKEENEEEARMEEPVHEEKLEPLETLSEEAASANVETEELSESESLIKQAENLKNDHDYAGAIDLYKRAAELSEDSAIQAECYEEMAMLYGMIKRYGTALAYAQKAYNLSPSTDRELLLARLYYKTGDTDKAARRVNNILQRDFTVD